MNINETAARIEAVLFSAGESVEISRMCESLGLTEIELREAVEKLKKDYSENTRGIDLIELEGAIQLVTKPEYYDDLISISKNPRKPQLTDTLMETLSVIAYRQPITKAEIEKIRGVSSDHAVNRLVEYELVKEVGRVNAPGRPILFGTTEEFLRRFGFSSKEDMPMIDPVKEEDFKAEAEVEINI
ncbi:MAG: SMC-Scp complex subunit ScpB [Candidatus Alectryocaccobium sp.]|jgi:segregation and condensation protein B